MTFLLNYFIFIQNHLYMYFFLLLQDNYNALHIAAMYSREDVVKLLLSKRGVDPYAAGGVSYFLFQFFFFIKYNCLILIQNICLFIFNFYSFSPNNKQPFIWWHHDKLVQLRQFFEHFSMPLDETLDLSSMACVFYFI